MVKDMTASGEPLKKNKSANSLKTELSRISGSPTQDTPDNPDSHVANPNIDDDLPVPSCHPSPPRDSNDTSRQLGGLAPELLLNIIQHLDAPFLVCLGLTSRTFHTLILETFQVGRLCELCPKDVRAPMHPALRPSAYNILAAEDEPVTKGWRIKNFTLPPPFTFQLGADIPRNIQLTIERLAYIRRVAWHSASHPQSSSQGPFTGAAVFAVQPFPSACYGVGLPVPVDECRAYIDWCAVKGREEGGLVMVEMRIFGLYGLWARTEVKSVEFMVLRALLDR